MRRMPDLTNGHRRLRRWDRGCWALLWLSGEDFISMLQHLTLAIGLPTSVHDPTATHHCPFAGNLGLQRDIVAVLDLTTHTAFMLHRFVKWTPGRHDVLEGNLALLIAK